MENNKSSDEFNYNDYDFDQFIEEKYYCDKCKDEESTGYYVCDCRCINCEEIICECMDDLPNDYVYVPEYDKKDMMSSAEEERILNQIIKDKENKEFKELFEKICDMKHLKYVSFKDYMGYSKDDLMSKKMQMKLIDDNEENYKNKMLKLVDNVHDFYIEYLRKSYNGHFKFDKENPKYKYMDREDNIQHYILSFLKKHYGKTDLDNYAAIEINYDELIEKLKEYEYDPYKYRYIY